MAKLRKDFSDNLKWQVKDLFKTVDDYKKAYKKLEEEVEEYPKYQGHILDSADNLLELLEFDTNFNRNLEQLFVYAHIQNDQDTMDPFFQEMSGQVSKLYEKASEKTSYIVPEILNSNYQKIAQYINEKQELKAYERQLKEIFKIKKHTLSPKEEKLLSSMYTSFKTPDDVYSLLKDADMIFGSIKNAEGKKEELNEQTYRKFLESPNRKVRKEAFTKLLKTYGNFKNTYATLLMAEVKNNNKIASIRGYKSALSASLYANDIPEEIYNNLIVAVKQNIEPLSKYWQFKKEALGVSNLHIYDTYTSITSNSIPKYTEKEAQELLTKALSPLKETYIKDLNKAFTEKWIDFCPNAYKRSGAYCTASYNVHPYVLLSFDGSLNSVSTLAHELGHAMHYYYAIQNQPYQDYSYSIFVAEVASQVNQILLSKYLITHTSNKETKKYLIDDLIGDFKATIYRQTMFAEFEKIIHEKDQAGEILTQESLCNIYYDLNKEYYGKNIIVDDIIKYEWERIPHFYMNFYVYEYATAYAAAIKIAMDILNHKDQAVEKYLEFLKLGCTKTPIESLKVAGVDMSKSTTIAESFKYFNDLVEELTNLYHE